MRPMADLTPQAFAEKWSSMALFVPAGSPRRLVHLDLGEHD